MTAPTPERGQTQATLSGELTYGGYWETPPYLWAQLEAKFGKLIDVCPYPMIRDALKVPWSKEFVNFANAPFRAKDGSPTGFMRKAIEEQARGCSSILTLPTQSYVNMALEHHAELTPLGRVRYIHTQTKKPQPDPSNITLFYLKGVRA